MWGPILKSSKPLFWPNKDEKFKLWTITEKEKVLVILSGFPNWLNISISRIYRSVKSKVKSNPASSLPMTREITLYDDYSKQKNQKQILVHELAHVLYYSLADEEKSIFEMNSGWKRSRNRLVPPKKLLKDDSSQAPEEDFCNYIDEYVTNSKKIKKFNHKMFEFLSKRFPL